MPDYLISQMMKDKRFQKAIGGVKTDLTEEFLQRFQEFDEVVDASVRIYMSDGFRGVINSPKNGEDGEPIQDTRSALLIKAEAILCAPHDQIEAEEERQ